MTQTRETIDTVTLEVLWNRVLSVTNEQQAALIRTAFSTVVRESQDLACGVFDTRGNMIAQSDTGTPGHINAMATCMRHFMAVYPEDTLSPGDVLITNDPWMTAGQINDITLVTPIFRNGHVAAYFANTCHMVDIGGRILSAEAREVYEEGLYIPIMKLFDAGERNEVLFKLIRGNVRTPDEVEGDLHAMATCNDVGGRRLLEFMDEFGLDSIDPLADQIIERSERAMRAAISEIPDGEYENEVWSDGYEEPVLLKARVIVHGDELTVDHTGSSPQSRFGINVVLNYTHAYTSFAIKCAISPEVPHNEGAFRPVHVIAPEGLHPECNASRPGGGTASRGPLSAGPHLRRAGESDAGSGDGRWRGLALDHHVPRQEAERRSVHIYALPVRWDRRPANQGRLEQRGLPQRRGRRAGGGHGESHKPGDGATRGPPRLRRPGPLPWWLRSDDQLF